MCVFAYVDVRVTLCVLCRNNSAVEVVLAVAVIAAVVMVVQW